MDCMPLQLAKNCRHSIVKLARFLRHFIAIQREAWGVILATPVTESIGSGAEITDASEEEIHRSEDAGSLL